MGLMAKAIKRSLGEMRMALARVRFARNVRIGARTYARRGFFLNPGAVGARISIGKGCFFNRYCSINCHESIVIGDGCTFGEGVKIYDHDHNFRKKSEGEQPYISRPVTIGNGVWCGSNVLILKGVTIGEGAVVGGVRL